MIFNSSKSFAKFSLVLSSVIIQVALVTSGYLLEATLLAGLTVLFTGKDFWL